MNNILVVTAHPDDEICMASSLFRLVHEFKKNVDFVVLTKGEGGRNYANLAKYIYGKNFQDKDMAKELGATREQEMKSAVRILGGRSLKFLKLNDFGYTKSLSETLGNWGESAKKQVGQIKWSNYDVIFTLFPAAYDHGHHKATVKLVLEALKDKKLGLPVLACRIQDKAEYKSEDLASFFNQSAPKVLSPYITLNRETRFGRKKRLSLQIPVNWVIAAHKTQGAAQSMMGRDQTEQFYWMNETDEYRGRLRELKNALESVPSPSL